MADNDWNCDFAKWNLFQDVAFALTPLLYRLGENLSPGWPSLDDFQTYLDAEVNPIAVGDSKRLRIVPQAGKAKTFRQTYLSRIYHDGEIQTRNANWHDLFQILSWRLFPQSKAVLVERHYHCARQRWQNKNDDKALQGRRSNEENLLSLLDEGGLVLLSDEIRFPQLIRQFRWQQLFIQCRPQLKSHLRMMVFGHALFDKLRHPYVGLTANAVLLPLSSSAMKLSTQALLPQVDHKLSTLLKKTTSTHAVANSPLATNSGYTSALNNPRDLQPFPLLGMPGLWPGNETAEFYLNQRYFRPGRRQQQTSLSQ